MRSSLDNFLNRLSNVHKNKTKLKGRGPEHGSTRGGATSIRALVRNIRRAKAGR